MESDFNTDNPGVRITCNRNNAVNTCLDGLFGMFNNLPCPTVHNVGDHACMKIFDVICHHLAMGRGFEFTESPSETDHGTTDRLSQGIHGCIATTELISQMKAMTHPVSQSHYYSWITTWSDSFLPSYVKQKMNNV